MTRKERNLQELSNKSATEELLRVSWYYYKLGMTQTMIAKKLNTNRARVMKLLDTALEQGIVEITIKDPRVNLLSIEEKLKAAFDLKDAVVVPAEGMPIKDLNGQLGLAAAQYITTLFNNGDVLAVGWGDSVSKTVKHLSLDGVRDFHLISLSGGMLPLLTEWSFFGKYLQHLKILPAPLLVSNSATAEAIYNEPEVEQILQMSQLSSYALVGIGNLSSQATVRQKGYLNEVDQTTLKKKGAVGDILAQFYDKDGNHIPYETDSRLIALSIEQIKQLANVIGVAGGLDKVQAISAALKGGYIDILITDEGVAKALLDTSAEE